MADENRELLIVIKEGVTEINRRLEILNNAVKYNTEFRLKYEDFIKDLPPRMYTLSGQYSDFYTKINTKFMDFERSYQPIKTKIKLLWAITGAISIGILGVLFNWVNDKI